jgi:hypothetical protein
MTSILFAAMPCVGEELHNDIAMRLGDLRFDVVERGLFGRLGIGDHGLKLLAQLRRIRIGRPGAGGNRALPSLAISGCRPSRCH